MRPCPHLLAPAPGGFLIETLILLLFGLTFVVILVVAIARMLTERNRSREEARRSGFPDGERSRTDEQRVQDKRTSIIWVCAALLVPCVLVAAYLLTR